MTKLSEENRQDIDGSSTNQDILNITKKLKDEYLKMNVPKHENGVETHEVGDGEEKTDSNVPSSSDNDRPTEKPQETDKSSNALIKNSGEAKEDDVGTKLSLGEDGGEVLVITDTGFNVKIICPGMEHFEIPVSSMELVQEVYQVLMDREDTCHRTCFSLQLDGQTLDNFTELKSIEGLKEGSELKVVEEPYTGREARLHVRHLRDLLKSIDSGDAYNGFECASLSFLNTVTSGNILENRPKLETIDCTPPEYIMPGSKEPPILPLHPIGKDLSATPQCVKVLTTSAWNPPDGRRKLHGDLIYLYLVTLEEKKYHISACTQGFFVNQSTNDVFNPKPAEKRCLSHSLVDLLNQISPLFKRNFQQLLKIRQSKHPFERVNTPYQIYSWLAPIQDPTLDAIRAEDACKTRLGYEEHIPGQTRDWNEELQTTRELSRKTLPDRLMRERAIFKVHSDFVSAATRGTIAVIDGNIMAINPSEDAKMQMFLWNNIFFSLGFDVKDHYKDFGGDHAAYIAPGNDLQGVKAYSQVDFDGLYTLGTVVLDYRGYRVTAQSIIPGILEREQEQSVVFGSIDFGKTVVKNEKYTELLQKPAKTLRIKSHKVINDKDEMLEISSSVECKGIVGNDNRHYILDLLRTFPPDANFLPVDGEEYSEKVRALGFPRKLCHSLVTLRQEVIDHFVESKYSTFLRIAAQQFQQIKKKKIQEAQENKEKASTESESKELSTKQQQQFDAEEAKKIVEGLMTGDASKEIVRAACEAVGSQKDNEFELRFNPDVFQPHVKHEDPEGEVYKRDKQLVKDVAEFLLVHQIPTFVQECLEHSSSPGDGFMLSEALHHSGINMRYLGTVTEMVSKYPSLSYLHSICIGELICRSAKHIFKTYMQGVEMMSLSAGISHFMNCLLSSYSSPHTTVATDELQSQRSKKRNRKKNKYVSLGSDNNDWALETPKLLWRKLVEETKTYFSFKLDCDSMDTAAEKYDLNKIAMLRSFCKKLGVQLLLREYNMDSKTKQCFYEEDVVNMFPVVKNIHPRASDAYHVFTSGQAKIQQGLLRDGYELISEALNLLNNVYGAMHPEIAACNRLLARLNYIMGDYGEALVFQQRAVLMSERVLGIDHPNTITEYAHLALYCFANNQIPTALQLMYRARYLALLCHGENHPEVALYDSNIGLILQGVGEFDLSLKFLQKALQLNIKYFGEKSLKVAMNYHLVARTNSCKGDFRTALQHEREAWDIYKQTLGEQHEKTKDSGLLVKKLMEEAVKLQKAVNQLQKGETTAMPHIQMYTPSLQQVLETLNMINGIVFVHISPEDIEKFKQEMLKKQNGDVDYSNFDNSIQDKEDTTTSAPNQEMDTAIPID